MKLEQTICTWYHQCTKAAECSRVRSDTQMRWLVDSGREFATFVGPPICHSEWKDREDLPDE